MCKKIDWMKKLSSRKFWAMITGVVISVLVAFEVGQEEITKITGILSSISVLIVYILAETSIDKARENNKSQIDYVDTGEGWHDEF